MPPSPTRPGPRAQGTDGCVVLHSTWVGTVTALLSPALLVALAAIAIDAVGVRAVPLVFLLVGVVTGGVSLLTFPRRSIISTDGVTRVCWGRRQHLTWDDVRVITRAPKNRRHAKQDLRARSRGEPAEPTATGTSGLLAKSHGRRRWLLTDQAESQFEYDEVAAILDQVPGTSLRARRPPADSTPTDLYRRSR